MWNTWNGIRYPVRSYQLINDFPMKVLSSQPKQRPRYVMAIFEHVSLCQSLYSLNKCIECCRDRQVIVQNVRYLPAQSINASHQRDVESDNCQWCMPLVERSEPTDDREHLSLFFMIKSLVERRIKFSSYPVHSKLVIMTQTLAALLLTNTSRKSSNAWRDTLRDLTLNLLFSPRSYSPPSLSLK